VRYRTWTRQQAGNAHRQYHGDDVDRNPENGPPGLVRGLLGKTIAGMRLSVNKKASAQTIVDGVDGRQKHAAMKGERGIPETQGQKGGRGWHSPMVYYGIANGCLRSNRAHHRRVQAQSGTRTPKTARSGDMWKNGRPIWQASCHPAPWPAAAAEISATEEIRLSIPTTCKHHQRPAQVHKAQHPNGDETTSDVRLSTTTA
jgi:hypothetical protein